MESIKTLDRNAVDDLMRPVRSAIANLKGAIIAILVMQAATLLLLGGLLAYVVTR